jgi:signal-transduction protein with cAMP-binding, CBS, and nucleotidyltransferase domain
MNEKQEQLLKLFQQSSHLHQEITSRKEILDKIQKAINCLNDQETTLPQGYSLDYIFTKEITSELAEQVISDHTA